MSFCGWEITEYNFYCDIYFMEKTRILDHEEYLNFEQHKGSYRPDYYFDSSAVSRRVAFYHGYLLMRHIEARAESK